MVTLANPVPLVTAIVTIVPVGILFFAAYGRFDGTFRDNVVFLFFMGGLLIGAFASIFAVVMAEFYPVLFTTAVPLLYAVMPAAALNRKKWQGERHSVFNGGAMGLGIAAMTAFAFTFRSLGQDLTWGRSFTWGALTFGLAGAFYAAGLVVGNGVAERKPLRAVILAALGTVPFFFLFYSGWLFHMTAPAWIVPSVLLGLVAFAYALARIMPKGVAPGGWRHARRLKARSS